MLTAGSTCRSYAACGRRQRTKTYSSRPRSPMRSGISHIRIQARGPTSWTYDRSRRSFKGMAESPLTARRSPMKIPNADHPITIEPNPKRVAVTFNRRTIADTTHALTLREANLPAVQYIPRQDVDMTVLERTTHASHCPYKGDAGYYSIRVAGREA